MYYRSDRLMPHSLEFYLFSSSCLLQLLYTYLIIHTALSLTGVDSKLVTVPVLKRIGSSCLLQLLVEECFMFPFSCPSPRHQIKQNHLIQVISLKMDQQEGSKHLVHVTALSFWLLLLYQVHHNQLGSLIQPFLQQTNTVSWVMNHLMKKLLEM